MKVSAKNVMKQKHFHKGIEQLVQEGAILFAETFINNSGVNCGSSWKLNF
jgi:peptide chain release factor 3